MIQRQASLEELYSRHLAGDPGALNELCVRLTPELRELARRLGADSEQCDDALQELWLAVLRSGDSFDATRPLRPWLHGMLRFKWRSSLRRERRLRALIEEACVARVRSAYVEHDFASNETAALLRDALAKLPEAYRAPLELSLVHGLSPAEIARRLALPRSSVRVLLHRGRARLRAELPRGLPALLVLLLMRRSARAASFTALACAAAAVVLFAGVAAWSRSSEEARPGSLSASAEHGSDASSAPLADAGELLAESERRPAVFDRELAIEVVDGAGRPVAGVGLRIEPLDGTDPRLHTLFASTDANGIARIERPAGVALRVLSDRRAEAELGADDHCCRLTVLGGRSVHGRVVDELGRAVADAGVWLGDLDESRRGQVVTRTAGDGSFALEHVQGGASVAALANGHRRTAMLAIGDELELRATRGGGRVEVRVSDAHGAPIAGARVYGGRSVDGLPPHLAQELLPAFPPALEGVTDGGGHCSLAGFEPGEHNVVVRASGCAPALATVAIDDGCVRELAIELSLGASIAGRVVDEHGEPLAGAQVAWRGADALAAQYLTTTHDGRFTADGLPPGAGTLAARGERHDVVERALDVAAGVRAEIELVLSERATCRGTLRDDAELALAGYAVRWIGQTNADARATGADGEFELDLQGNWPGAIQVRGPGWPQWTTLRCATSSDELAVVLPRDDMPTSFLRGRLRYADGSPARDRRLDLVFADRSGAVVWLAGACRTNQRGELVLGPLGAGRCALYLARSVHDGDNGPLGLVGQYELARDATLDVGCVLPEAGEIESALVFADGARPAGPVINLAVGGNGPGLALAREPAARFRVLPGIYTLHAMGEDFAWVDSDEIEVAGAARERWSPELERALSTRIALAELPRDVDVSAGLTITRAGDGRAVGRFELARDVEARQVLQSFLPAGDYCASVREQDGETKRVFLRVASASARPLELRFVR